MLRVKDKHNVFFADKVLLILLGSQLLTSNLIYYCDYGRFKIALRDEVYTEKDYYLA